MELIERGGDEIRGNTPNKCVGCGSYTYYRDSLCGRCVELVPHHIPREQWKAYFRLNKDK